MDLFAHGNRQQQNKPVEERDMDLYQEEQSDSSGRGSSSSYTNAQFVSL